MRSNSSVRAIEGIDNAFIRKASESDIPKTHNNENVEKGKVSTHTVNYVTCHITSLPLECFVSNVTDCAVKCWKYNFNILRTTVSADISIPPVVQFQIASSVLYWKRLLKIPNRNHRLMRDSRKAEKECEKGETYFSTSCIRFTNSSSEPPMSKKSSITVPSTPFLAHDIRASESSGEKKVAAPDK